EGVPPALLAGVLGHLHQRLDDALVLHLVDPAQVADVALADAAPAVLQAADLRLRHQQPFRHLLRRHALELTEPAQLLAQPASPDGGIDIGRHGTCTSGCVPRTCSYLPLCVSAAQQTATKVHPTAGKRWICDGGTSVCRDGRHRGPPPGRLPARRWGGESPRSPRPDRTAAPVTGSVTAADALPRRPGSRRAVPFRACCPVPCACRACRVAVHCGASRCGASCVAPCGDVSSVGHYARHGSAARLCGNPSGGLRRAAAARTGLP